MNAAIKREFWKPVAHVINFDDMTPIYTANSLHIYEERYEIDHIIYRVLYAINDNEPISIDALVM